MTSGKTLIIIPTFNERENIVQLIDRLLELYPQVDVFVVDDSSKDGTADAVREAQQRHGERLQLLVRSGKGGRGSAVLEGMLRALAGPYEYAMEMDADFSHRPEEVASLLEKIRDCDCVIGSRYLPGSEIRDWGWKRTIFSHLANFFAKSVLRIPISDYTNGFRCYTRPALEAIELRNIDAKGYVVLSEVAYQLHEKGFRFGEIPTLFVNRRRGVSNLGFHEINEALFSVLRIRWPRLSGVVQDIGTFLLRGVISALIDLAVLIFLHHHIGLGVLPSLILSSLVAIGVMFFLRKKRWGAGAGLSVDRFLVLYGGIGALTILVAILLHQWMTSIVLSKAIAIVLLSPLSYLVSRRLLPQ